MPLRIFGWLWRRNRSLLERERRRVREHREQLEQDAARDKREREESEERLELFLIAAAFSQQVEVLAGVVEDVTHAVRLAYERAQMAQEAAHQALELARQNAITLPDGQRVYFAKGGALYTERREQITDESALEAARQAFASLPDVTTYAAYLGVYEELDDTTAQVARLNDTLSRLDDIGSRLREGDLDAEELKQLQLETEELIAGLPSVVRADYESLQAVRGTGADVAYRELAAGASSVLKAQFDAAGSLLASGLDQSEPATEAESEREPAYRSVPDF